jgi:hypothetical protein
VQPPRLAVFVALVACARGEAAPVSWPEERWLVDDDVGIGFAVPADWTLERAPTGLVASGPEGTPTYYTTLTLQTLDPPLEVPLASLLDTGYTNDAITNIDVLATRACVAGDALALCYDITFDVFDEHRHRVGALINAVPYVVDVSYLTPAAELDDTVAVFERALETLYIEPAG